MLTAFAIWLAFFAPLAGGTYFGFVEGVPGAQNLAMFTVWAVWLPLSAIAMSDRAIETEAVKPPRPAWVRWLSLMLLWPCVGVLVWAGAFATAGALPAAIVFGAAGRQAADKIRKAKAAGG